MSKKEKDFTKMVSYKKGYESYFNNNEQCPYKSEPDGNNKRIAWWTGYYDARVQDKLGHLFKDDKEK